MTEWLVPDIADAFDISHEEALDLVAELEAHGRARVLERDGTGQPVRVDVTQHRQQPVDDEPPPDHDTPRWRAVAHRASKGGADPTWRGRWQRTVAAAHKQATRWAARAPASQIDAVIVECSDGTVAPVWP